jgi:amino acid adenylation domain-containing protein
VELGEVESALAGEAGVAACAAAVREAGPGDLRLAAWVVAAAGARLEPARLAQRLRARLPEYMVPAAIEVVAGLPLTPNGKLDRQGLPAPRWGAGLSGGYAAARDALEERLCELYGEVLGVARVGIHDDFFALGGHSLLATRLVSRVRDVLGVELGLKALFEAPTVAGLAGRLPGTPARGAPVRRRPGGQSRVPLSWPQQRLWFLEQLSPGNAAYHLHVAYRLRGAVDAAALAAALQAVVERHEALRTTFRAVAGEPWQEIAPRLAVGLERVAAGAADEARLQGLLRARIESPFDLVSGPLLRATLVALGPEEQVLLLVVHHIVADGWSLALLLGELSAAYGQLRRGAAVELPALPVQYGDYAQWQRAALDGAPLQRQLDYWRAQLADAPPRLELPTDRPRPAVAGNRGAWHTLSLPAELATALGAVARDYQATLFMVLLAGFQALLSRWTGAEDLVVGTPVAGRPRTELEGLVGFFVNTLPLRGDLAGDPAFGELLRRVKRTALDAWAHADVPFERLVEELAPTRSLAHAPLAQVLFVFHNEPRSPLALDGIEALELVVPAAHAKLDLSLHVAVHDGALVTSFAYNSELFDATTIADLADGYAALLAAVVGAGGGALRLGELPVLGAPALARAAAEAARLRPAAVTMAAAAAASGTLAASFLAQAAAQGEREAVRGADGAWRYAELARRAGQVAGALGAAGAPGTPVALLLGHDPPMVAGLLGAVLAGRPYVPLDPYAPAARHAAVLADAAAGAVVTDAARLAAAPWLRGTGLPLVVLEEAFAATVRAPAGAAAATGPAPSAPAYLLYTSGTTGRPKAVVQTQAGALGQVLTWAGQLGLTRADRLTLLAGYGYDAAVQDVFGALLTGASLQVLDLRGGESAPELVDRIARDGVTVVHATPTVYRFLFGGRVTCEQDLARVRLVVLGGEAARRSDLELFKVRFRRPARLVNGLGLTECTAALQYFADHDTRVLGEGLPVGLPVAGVAASVLGADGAPGAWQGELVLATAHLAQGYHGDAALTASRFEAPGAGATAGRAPGRRLRTGDRVRRLPDGQWLHAGRLDRQLQVRGIRVEPAEVEAALRAVAGVADTFVDARAGEDGEAVLVGWIAGPAAPDDEVLRRALRAVLPDALVPARLVRLRELPRLPNGKVDRAALPAAVAPPAGAPPRTAAERRLAALWCEVLGRESVGVHDDFFALGGHSLAAARLAARLRDAFGVEVPLAALFGHTTVAALAAHVLQLASQAGAVAGPDGDAGVLPAIRRLARRPAGAPGEGGPS